MIKSHISYCKKKKGAKDSIPTDNKGISERRAQKTDWNSDLAFQNELKDTRNITTLKNHKDQD